MLKIWQFFIDLVFPPSQEELLLRSMKPSDIMVTAKKAEPAPLPFTDSSLSYKDPLVAELVWQIKYKKNKHAVLCGAFILLEKLREIGINEGVLIPIPISKKRRRERGFNQCELLVDQMILLDLDKRFSKDFGVLYRPRHIEKQTLKNRAERLGNIKGIFEIRKKDVSGKIILIDDVATTGSTLKEAYDTFLENGYRDIVAVTIAH